MADGFQSILDPNSETIRKRTFSVAELDAMFDAEILSRDEKIELIEGEIIQVNSQMMPHGAMKFNLASKLLASLPQTYRVSVEQTVQLNNNTIVDPDIFVTPKVPLERRYVRCDEVLLAIEVADTSLAYDTGVKATLYAKAGVREMWVIDINAKQTWVHREPSKAGYKVVTKQAFSASLAPLFYPDAAIVVGGLLT